MLAPPADASVDASSNVAQRASSPQPPVTRLYRHALEGIFAFCRVPALASIMAVNRDWQAAVLSMPPVRAATVIIISPSDPVPIALSCARSRLSRHVIAFVSSLKRCADDVELPLPHFELEVLSSHMPHLASLSCKLHLGDLTTARMVGRFTRLTTLRVKILSAASLAPPSHDRAQTNLFIEAIAHRLPLLHTLEITVPRLDSLETDPAICFRSLSAVSAATSALRSFSIQCALAGRPMFSATQIAEMRAMYWIDRLEWKAGHKCLVTILQQQEDESMQAAAAAAASSPTLSVISSPVQQPPPSLQWQSLTDGIKLDGSLTPRLLRHLPHLTHLDALVKSVRVPLLHALPNLRSLKLAKISAYPEAEAGPVESHAFMLELQHCRSLTSLHLLDLPAPMDSDLLATILPSMRHLSNLHLIRLPALTSLAFLATESLANSLRDLEIVNCESIPLAELVHLHGLRSLEQLNVTKAFSHERADLPSSLLAPFRWPASKRSFPNLKRCQCAGLYFSRH